MTGKPANGNHGGCSSGAFPAERAGISKGAYIFQRAGPCGQLPRRLSEIAWPQRLPRADRDCATPSSSDSEVATTDACGASDPRVSCAESSGRAVCPSRHRKKPQVSAGFPFSHKNPRFKSHHESSRQVRLAKLKWGTQKYRSP